MKVSPQVIWCQGLHCMSSLVEVWAHVLHVKCCSVLEINDLWTAVPSMPEYALISHSLDYAMLELGQLVWEKRMHPVGFSVFEGL